MITKYHITAKTECSLRENKSKYKYKKVLKFNVYSLDLLLIAVDVKEDELRDF